MLLKRFENPFDIAKNQFFGIDSRNSTNKKRLAKTNYENYDHIKESDLKNDIREVAHC